MSKPASTTGKRRADGTEVSNGIESLESIDNISFSDEDIKALETAQKAQDRVELAVERSNMRTMAESYAKRRPALKGLKNFWLIALRGHSHVQYNIQHKEDVQALSYLEDIWVERDPREFRAFTIEFHFAPNPFFHDTVLKKQYIFKPPPEASANVPEADGISQANIDFDWERDIDIPLLKINWKDPSKALTKLYPRIPDPEDADDTLERGSFFNIFEQPDKDIDTASTIANEVFSDAINYFFGRGENSNLGAFDEDSDEDSEEDGSDEDEIDLEKPRKKAKAA